MNGPAIRGPLRNFAWDDVILGACERSSTFRVQESDALRFAREFDPLPVHVDPAEAAASPFGGLTCSGSHIFAIRQKLMHDFAFAQAVIAAIGVDEVRYHAPLRPGQTCHVEIEFISKTASRTRADRGIATIKVSMFADDVLVLSLTDIALMRRRMSQ